MNMSTERVTQACRLLEETLRADPARRTRWKRPILEAMAGLEPAPSAPAIAIVGDACPMTPTSYHLDCLTHLDWTRIPTQLKVRFHLLELGSQWNPTSDAFRPLVSVVVCLGESEEANAVSVRSALAQAYQPIEVIVTGPASSQESSDADPRIRRVITTSARRGETLRRGVAQAQGDFILFLMSGDELPANIIDQHRHVLSSHPDARLLYLEELPTGQDADRADVRPITGDALLSVSSRFAPSLSGAMAPRWYLEQVGFPEDTLDRSAGTRYLFQMARRGLKAVARLDATMAPREGHATWRVEELVEGIQADLACVRDLAGEPRRYRYVACLLARATWLLDRAFDEGVAHEQIEDWHAEILSLEGSIGRGLPSAEGLSALLADQLVLMLRQKTHRTADATRPMLRLWAEREEQLLERIREVRCVTGSDMRRWLPDVPPRPFAELTPSEQVGLKFALEQLQVSVVLGELSIRLAALERVAADYPGHPYERYWRGAFRLGRLVGDEMARQVVRQRLYRSGWQFLGQARRVLSSSRAG
jgi:hypothetical protein